MNKHIIVLLSAIILANIGNSKSFAEAVLPSSTEAGAVNKKIEQDVKNNIIDTKEKTKNKKEKENTLENKVETNQKIEATVEKSGFVLKKIEFEGNTVYTNEELQKLISEKVGSFIGMDDLKGIIRTVTNHYVDDGYITSFSYLPAQRIKDGVLKLKIVESKVASIKIEGNKWAKTGFLKNNIFKEKGVIEGEPFNTNKLQKALGELNEINYLKGRVILQKADDMESAQIILEAKDRFPLMFNAGVDNRGTGLIGKHRNVITIADENITGYGDRLYVTNVLASRTYGLNTSYYLPLGPYGTEMRVGYGYSDVSLGKDYRIQGINGRAHNFNIGLIQPIKETKTFKMESDVTFDMGTSATFINQRDLYHRYNTRALRMGLNAIKDDTRGRWVSRFEVSTGLGSNDANSFVKLNPSLVRVQMLPYKTTGLLKIAGQYSPNKLFPNEQIAVGGMNTVRGFEEGLNYGDKGYFLTLELRKTIPYLRDYKFLKLKDRLALATFYDHGWSSVKGSDEGYHSFLQSVGFGIRYNINKYMNANIDFGIPLGRDRTGDQKGMRLHFNVSSGLI